MADVHLPTTLTALFDGLPRRLEVDAPTVEGAIDELNGRWPGLRDRLCDPGPVLHRHIHVYVDRERAALDTALEPRSRLDVIAAISGGTASPAALDLQLEEHRQELTAYCYRMLGSVEAEDAVQETLIRAWRAYDRFEGRSSLRSWLYRIATNVCFDLLAGRERRARPADLGPAGEPVLENLHELPEASWIQPIPDRLVVREVDPAEAAVTRETIRLAFVAALQHLPPKQRATLILCEVLRWHASEVAELLDTSVASVNSALQRARDTLAKREPGLPVSPLGADDRALLERYVAAFEQYDIEALTSLIHEDATQSMPPYDLWLSGRDDILAWWFGPGIGCTGSRVIPAGTANGAPAFGQYKRAPDGGHEPWALQVVELSGGRIGEFTFFLDTATLFPLFGLPARLQA